MEQTKRRTPDIEIQLGARLRQLRNYNGFTQEQLAACVGITFQQLQKYEKGTNRMSASRLLLFSKALNIDPKHFYESIEVDVALGHKESVSPKVVVKPAFNQPTKEEMQLLRFFRENPKPLQSAISAVSKAGAGAVLPDDSPQCLRAKNGGAGTSTTKPVSTQGTKI